MLFHAIDGVTTGSPHWIRDNVIVWKRLGMATCLHVMVMLVMGLLVVEDGNVMDDAAACAAQAWIILAALPLHISVCGWERSGDGSVVVGSVWTGCASSSGGDEGLSGDAMPHHEVSVDLGAPRDVIIN